MGLVDDKVVLVTGAGSGIGRAMAELCAAEGARGVVVVDRDEDGGKETVSRIGEGARFLAADVTDETQVAAIVQAAVEAYGRLDCALNNAGMSGVNTPFTELALEQWQQVIAVNLTSVFLCLKHELAQMVAQGGGAIVNTSSGAGVVGFPGLPHYVASKHGVLGLTKTAALEYAKAGIRVNAVCPGTTDTPMVRSFIGGNAQLEAALRSASPTGELARAEQIAEAAVWLCSDRASFVSGEAMLVDGGTVCR